MTHTKLVQHPLKNAWMVVNITFPFIPPFIGTKRECERAQIAAERNAENRINQLK